jgi:CHAT domain
MVEEDMGSPDPEERAITLLVTELRGTPPSDWDARLGAALLEHGVWLVGTLADMSRSDAFAEQVLGRSWQLAVEWLRGRELSGRADEPELRAALARRLLAETGTVPVVELSCALALLALPAGHEWRDPAVVRPLLWRVARRARATGDAGVELTALRELVRHRLVSHRSILAIVRRGVRLAAADAQPERQAFLFAVAGYFAASAARAPDGSAAARRWAVQSMEYARLASQIDTGDPVMRALGIMATATGLDSDGSRAEAARLYEEGMAVLPRGDPAWQQAAMRAGVLRSMLGEPAAAAADLAPAVPLIEAAYLAAVHQDEVLAEAENFAHSSWFLAFCMAADGEWASSFRCLDRSKSLRSRYRSALSRIEAGRDALAAERRLVRVSRGAMVTGGEGLTRAAADVSARAKLLEEYRQARAKLPAAMLAEADIGALGRVLPSDQAVVALGAGHLGTLVFVICAGDSGRPTAGFVLREWTDQKWEDLLVGENEDGWVYAIADPDRLIDARARLADVLSRADAAVGRPIAQALAGRGIRRLSVIPHLWLHLLPFWALPSLAAFDVSSEPYAAALLAPGAVTFGRRACLTVADPTLDLSMSIAESDAIERELGAAGWQVTRLALQTATVANVTAGLPSAEMLHFGGHGMADVSRPERSALRLYDDVATREAAAGRDPFGALAADAAWQPAGDGERVAEIPGAGVLHEIVFGGVGERRFEGAAGRTLWARYERGTARGAELWSAQDIVIGDAMSGCQLVLLSSCQAGQGGLAIGDEYAGLPAALRSAGARCVVAPLWPVSEDVAVLFVAEFVSGLVSAGPRPDIHGLVHKARLSLRDMTAGEAVAKLTALRSGNADRRTRYRLSAAARRHESGPPRPFAHPYDWAVFTASGPAFAEPGAPAGEVPATSAGVATTGTVRRPGPPHRQPGP